MKLKCNLFLAGCFILLSFFIYACSNKKVVDPIIPSCEFSPYISAYTGGIITKNTPIQIEFTQDQSGVELYKKVKVNPFKITPKIEGEVHWVNANTLEFTPSENLKSGEHYIVDFNLNQFISVPKELSTFTFSFQVIEQLFTLAVDPIQVTTGAIDKVKITGTLTFSDSEPINNIESILSAQLLPQKESVSVKVMATNANTYQFTLSEILRKDEEQKVELMVDGNLLGIAQKEQRTLKIPALNSFELLEVQPIDLPENGFSFTFSDPVSATQDLTGLIELSGVTSFTFQKDQNQVFLYYDPVDVENYTVKINQAVRNSNGKELDTDHTFVFKAQKPLPAVELLSEAAILPNSKELILPFRSVNLKAVDVQVIQIYENNILSFLQENKFSGISSLRKFARLIHKETLDLTLDQRYDLTKWNNFSVDLAKLFKQSPGSFYRIILSFKQEYSLYPCGEDVSIEQHQQHLKQTTLLLDDSAWDQAGMYYNEYYQNVDWSVYDWRERNNPCHPTYYMTGNRLASCNVMSSNIGVTVKRNKNQELWVALSDILTVDPIVKGEITVYNYQLQPIGKATTDSEGLAKMKVDGVPFVLVATSNQQTTYLRIADGEEKSTSRFDVGGEEVQKGLKGLLYGERGVWRPGDTLHLTFILDDEERRIPEKHPVSFELYNPRGQFYTKQISTEGVNGFYVFTIPTSQNDPTGVWNAYVKVGGSTFHKPLRIETIKPNRLKINLNIPDEVIQANKKVLTANLQVEWLTGAKAPYLKSQVELSLSRVNTQFKNFSNYQFNNPATQFSYQKQEVFKGELDNEGKATLNIALPEAKEAPGMLQAYFTTQVFEPGGNASIYTQTIPYSPFDAYVGIQMKEGEEWLTDEDYRIDLVVVDEKGKLLDERTLEYEIYKLDWSWWWDNSGNYLSNYVNNISKKPIQSDAVITSKGKAHLNFRIDYPDWGAYLIYVRDKEGGHATGGTVYVDWPSWRGRANRQDPSGITMLSFSVDKKEYKVGEKVTAIIPSASDGKALISLENGSRVLKQEWISVSSESDTKYLFEVTPEMAPNLYVHVTLLQPHAQTVNDLPIRMYGVVPVFVSNEDSKLTPQIEMPKELEPEKEFTITVSEKQGRAMTYTLAIVDEGLLDLTGFKTPSPWDVFNVREALGIRTWDMFDEVLGAQTGIFSSLFSIGGDEMLKQNDAKVNRFKPVVRFMGPFTLAKGKKQNHKIKLPMYVGSVRTMVVAGQAGSYGNAEKTTYVRSPLMLLSTLPRVVSTGEEISLPVNVFSFEKGVKEVSITVQSSFGKIEVADYKKSIYFSKPGDQVVYFNLRTKEVTGKETIKVTAQGGGKTAYEKTEIEVRNPNPPLTIREHKTVEGNKTENVKYDWEEKGEVLWSSLEVSRMPSFNLSLHLDYLRDYEHLCTEQLTSKALPLLYLSDLKPLSKVEEQQNKEEVQRIIQQLYGRQLSNGGFEFWPGTNRAHDWLTSYVGQFLLLAQEKGYAVQSLVIDRWMKYQQRTSQSWAPATQKIWSALSDTEQAYRLYSLALANNPNRGAMNRLKELKTLSLGARWRLAAAYALDGKKNTAEELIFNAETTVEADENQNLIFGSSIREDAMVLETLLLLGRDKEAMIQGEKMAKELTGESYYSTQSTAYAIYAMAKLSNQFAKVLKFDWTLNGQTQTVNSAKALYQSEISTKERMGELTFANHTDGKLNVTLTTKIQPLEDKLPSVAKNIQLEVKYTDMNGKSIVPDILAQGTEFYVNLRVSNISSRLDLRHLALSYILPSGWELFNTRMYDSDADLAKTSTYTYQDIRDDRVLTYFDLPKNTHKIFRFRLQAAYKGSYILPAVQCEGMYDLNTFARTTASKVEVK
ncbi:MAG: alpha-2-macroglobulin [Bacteroidales bacterium]|nr:alpha-2-macroglobulin [Bacteroidales bacterium]